MQIVSAKNQKPLRSCKDSIHKTAQLRNEVCFLFPWYAIHVDRCEKLHSRKSPTNSVFSCLNFFSKAHMPPIRICIFLLMGFVVVFGFLSFDGYYFYDDTTYARYAFQLAKGHLILNEETFSHRLGLIGPLAILYRLAGVHDIATVALPLVCTLATLLMLYLLLYPKHAQVAFWAVGLCALDFYTIFFSNKLYPDVVLTTMGLLAVISLYKRDLSWRWPVLFAIANLWGFACKETIVYLLPFYLLVWISDLRQKQHGTFWRRAFGVGIPLLIVYFGFYFVLTGNPLFRFQIIQEGHYEASYNYFHKPASALIPRLTYEPLLMLIHSGMIVCMLPATFLLFQKQFWRFSQWTDELFWGRVAVIGLGMFWLFTTSFKYYNPNALFPRMILFLIPFFSVASAYGLQKLMLRKITLLFLATVVCAAVAWQTGVRGMAVQYGAWAMAWLATGVGFRFFNGTIFQKSHLYALLVIGALLIHPVYTMSKPTENGYSDEKKLVQQLLANPTVETFVFTDDRLKNGYDYYYRFAPPATVRFLDFSQLSTYQQTVSSNRSLLVLINPYSTAYFSEIGAALPPYIQAIPANWKLLHQQGEVRLYQVLPK